MRVGDIAWREGFFSVAEKTLLATLKEEFFLL